MRRLRRCRRIHPITQTDPKAAMMFRAALLVLLGSHVDAALVPLTRSGFVAAVLSQQQACLSQASITLRGGVSK